MKFDTVTIVNLIAVLANICISYLSGKREKEKIVEEDKRDLRRIRADIISKSRITWINNVREHTAKLIENFHKYKYIDVLSNEQFEKEESLSDCLKEIILLRLYFQNNEEHDENSDVISIQNELFYLPHHYVGTNYKTEEDSSREVKLEEIKKVNEKIVTSLKDSSTNSKKNYQIENYLSELGKVIGDYHHRYDMVTEKKGNWPQDDDRMSNVEQLDKNHCIDQYMNDFVQIIGIYLKVEWDLIKDID